MANSKISVSSQLTTDELHLLGGLRAGTDKSGHLLVFPARDGNAVQFPVTDTSLYGDTFREIGVAMIGWERISVVDHGVQRSMWYLLDPIESGEQSPFTAADQWSWISHAAHLKDAIQISEIARNICFALRASSFRLRDISREYGRQNQLAVTNKIQAGRKFSNVEIFDFFLAMHSFLVEICSARDYLAKFISRVLFSGRADSMRGLLKELEKRSLQDPIADLVVRLCDRQRAEAWMPELANLRNMIVHGSPIANIGKTSRLTVRELKAGSNSFLQIYFGLPRKFGSSAAVEADALAYFREIMTSMNAFARKITAASPIPPAIPKIETEDLL